MTETPIQPRIMPRDMRDAAITVLCSVLQIGVLFVLPGVLVLWATHSISWALTISAWAYGIFLLFTVARLVITPAGIEVARLCGGPRFLKWEDITEVRLAPRSELLLRGWTWPLFPMREMTPSLSSVGHYRIQFGARWIYFPPKDAALFLASIRPYTGVPLVPPVDPGA
jgi:hypothetical protein